MKRPGIIIALVGAILLLWVYTMIMAVDRHRHPEYTVPPYQQEKP